MEKKIHSAYLFCLSLLCHNRGGEALEIVRACPSAFVVSVKRYSNNSCVCVRERKKRWRLLRNDPLLMRLLVGES